MKRKEINLLTKTKITTNLTSFEKGEVYTKDGGRHPLARYASFDYCFNYFQGFKNKNKTELALPNNIQTSCLHLGFYLASWGMYRGSSTLLQKSVKVFEPLIQYIASIECDVWYIDAGSYTDDNIKKLIACRKRIEKELNLVQKDMDTLVTKIMLGVFGNVPAFDSYFKSGSHLGTFNENALKKISAFYENYKTLISEKAETTKTYDYDTGKNSSRIYTKAKIIDMIFFIEGLKIEEEKKKEKKEKEKKEQEEKEKQKKTKK